MVIQALMFHKDYFTKKSAENWIRRHEFKPIKKLHETLSYYRARLKTPNENLYKYRIRNFRTGIKAVLEYPLF